MHHAPCDWRPRLRTASLCRARQRLKLRASVVSSEIMSWVWDVAVLREAASARFGPGDYTIVEVLKRIGILKADCEGLIVAGWKSAASIEKATKGRKYSCG